MKVLLLRAARIRHEAGDIVEVSPAEAGFLISTGSAVEAAEMNVVEAAEMNVVEAAEMNVVEAAEMNVVEAAEMNVVEAAEMNVVEAAEMNVVETPEKDSFRRETAVPVIEVPEDGAEKPAKTTRRKK